MESGLDPELIRGDDDTIMRGKNFPVIRKKDRMFVIASAPSVILRLNKYLFINISTI